MLSLKWSPGPLWHLSVGQRCKPRPGLLGMAGRRVISHVVLTDAFSVLGPWLPIGVGCWCKRLGEQKWAATEGALLARDVVPGGILQKSKVIAVWGQVVRAQVCQAESSGEWGRNGSGWSPSVWVRRVSLPSLDTPPMPRRKGLPPAEVGSAPGKALREVRTTEWVSTAARLCTLQGPASCEA